jgi:hydrogenase maturation protein HypF
MPTLAAGGDLKSTFALGARGRAVLSHHMGDLGDLAAHQAFEAAIAKYEEVYGIAPRRIVHDRHPDYASTRYAISRARREGLELLPVQHHHAHMAACITENGLSGPVLGVCFDGAGLGDDGTLWGGEFLLGTCLAVSRVAHLRYVRLPGGDRAAREPWRMAATHLSLAGEDVSRSPVAQRVPMEALRVITALIEQGESAPLTSSMGRLFDAVASLAGVCDRASFEGQAAMRLEAMAAGLAPAAGYAFELHEGDGAGPANLDPAPVVRAVLRDVRDGVSAAIVSRKFHTAVVDAVAGTCRELRRRSRFDGVVLTGGVFSNAILTAEIAERLAADGFRVHVHRTVPANDGGLSLGQLAVAAAHDSNGRA